MIVRLCDLVLPITVFLDRDQTRAVEMRVNDAEERIHGHNHVYAQPDVAWRCEEFTRVESSSSS